VRVLESVSQPFVASEKLYSTMETFRQMTNDCIRIGLAENKKSFMCLRYAYYPELANYEIGSAYKNNAMSRVSGILSNYRKLMKKGKQINKPYCWKPMLTTCKGYVLRPDGNSLILPNKIRIPLNGYVLKKIQGAEMRSVTVSTRTVSVCISREVRPMEFTEVILRAEGSQSNVPTLDT
jgi:putative transposase